MPEKGIVLSRRVQPETVFKNPSGFSSTDMVCEPGKFLQFSELDADIALVGYDGRFF